MTELNDVSFQIVDPKNHPDKKSKFDQFFASVHSLRTVKLSISCWELSECNCNFWHKHYKCFHIVMCAYREPKCQFKFDSIILLLPCERKANRGRKRKAKQALIRQSINNETTQIGIIENDDDHTDTDDQGDINANNAKKQKTLDKDTNDKPKCTMCGEYLMKKRVFYCPNKCSKKK
jgi:hypothetical protein